MPNAGEFGAAAPQEGFGNYKELQVQLVGSATVAGEMIVNVKVDASAELKATVDAAKQTAKLSGSLIANGPGSNGRTSPDAMPGAGGRGVSGGAAP